METQSKFENIGSRDAQKGVALPCSLKIECWTLVLSAPTSDSYSTEKKQILEMKEQSIHGIVVMHKSMSDIQFKCVETNPET